MTDEHITREMLEAVARGTLPPSDLVTRGWRHLMSLCSTCREEYSSFVAARRAAARPLRRPPEAGLQALEHLRKRLDDLRREAERDLRDLLDLVPEKRRLRVRRAVKRFSNPVLVELLIDESRGRVFDDPREAYELAQLGVDVAQRLPVFPYGTELPHELLLRATAHKANALRAAGNLRQAREVMELPVSKIDHLTDPLTRGEISSLAASLAKDQRRFEEALSFLDRALAAYRGAKEARLVGRTLVQKAQVFRDQGDPRAAIEVAEQALSLISSDGDPRLKLGALHDLTCYLAEAGRYSEARSLLARHRDLYDRFTDDWTQRRRRWVEGKVAQGLGEQEEAERAFLEVRDTCIDLGIGYDAALVSMDLALLYAEQGRNAEIMRLAEEVLPIFQGQDVHREALAALLLFQRAAHA